VSTPEAETIPTIIGGVRVVLCSQIDERHQQTGAGWRHLIDGTVRARAWGIAICESAEGDGFLVFTCKDDWIPVANTRHSTLEEAKRQAEFEYEGLESTWQAPPS
jgi:hypothetical protein